MAKSKKKKNKKKTGRLVFTLIIEILIILLLCGGIYFHQKLSKIDYQSFSDPVETNEIKEETQETLETYTTVALFGIDNRSNGNFESGNSDVIMVASINNKTKKVRLMSVYRDTSFDVDGNGKIRKANYAYNHGGPENAIAMLNRNLDLNIQDYVAVDFNALVDAIDAVGGIEMTLTETEAKWTNQYMLEVAKVTKNDVDYVEAGTHVLSGVQATAFCRVRYAGGDFRRAEVQRETVLKLAEKVRHASIGELNNLIDEVFPEISTSFKMSELLALASDAGKYEIDENAAFPFSMKGMTLKNPYGWLDFPCTLEDNVQAMYFYLYDEQDYEVSSTVKRISDDIINLSGYTAEDAVDEGYGTIETKKEEWFLKRMHDLYGDSSE